MLAREWTHDACWTLPAEDLAVLAELTEDLWRRARAAVARVLTRPARAAALGISPILDDLKRSWDGGDPGLVARLDFAIEPPTAGASGHALRLLEINADTPGALLEPALLQREWGAAVGRRTASDTLEAALAGALADLPRPLVILHHPGDPYIVELARYLASLADGCERVAWPEVPTEGVGTVYKIFRWARLLDGRFPEAGAFLARTTGRVLEPRWRLLAQHKGLLAEMWAADPDHPALLPTVLDGPGSLPDGGASGYAQKSFHGVSGQEVRVVGPEGPDRTVLEHGGKLPDDCVWQARAEMACHAGRYAVLSTCLVGDRFAGALIREDAHAVSYDDTVTPLGLEG